MFCLLEVPQLMRQGMGWPEDRGLVFHAERAVSSASPLPRTIRRNGPRDVRRRWKRPRTSSVSTLMIQGNPTLIFSCPDGSATGPPLSYACPSLDFHIPAVRESQCSARLPVWPRAWCEPVAPWSVMPCRSSATSSSRSQVQTSAVGAAACLTWQAPSVDVRWRTPLPVVIVTHLVTRSLAGRSRVMHWLTVHSTSRKIGRLLISESE